MGSPHQTLLSPTTPPSPKSQTKESQSVQRLGAGMFLICATNNKLHRRGEPKWDQEVVVRCRRSDNQHQMVSIQHFQGDQKTFFLWAGVSLGMGAGLNYM